jgi:hypothetical protein
MWKPKNEILPLIKDKQNGRLTFKIVCFPQMQIYKNKVGVIYYKGVNHYIEILHSA